MGSKRKNRFHRDPTHRLSKDITVVWNSISKEIRVANFSTKEEVTTLIKREFKDIPENWYFTERVVHKKIYRVK